MTSDQYRAERRHIYETRLGIFGLGPADNPTADQHNLAVAEADAHIQALKRENREGAIAPLLALRESLNK